MDTYNTTGMSTNADTSFSSSLIKKQVISRVALTFSMGRRQHVVDNFIIVHYVLI